MLLFLDFLNEFPSGRTFMLWWATPGSLSPLIFFKVSYFLIYFWWSESSLLCTGLLSRGEARAPSTWALQAVAAHGLRRYSSLAWAQAQQLCCAGFPYLVRFSPDQELRQMPVHHTARKVPFFFLSLLSPLVKPCLLGHLLRPCVHSEGCLVQAALVHQHFLFSPSILALWAAFLSLQVIQVQSWVFILLFPLPQLLLNPALPSAKS